MLQERKHNYPNYPTVVRDLNILKFQKLDHPKVVSHFINSIYHGQRAGFEEFILDFSNVKATFPNAATPISGIIDYYRDIGINFKRIDNNSIIASSHLFNSLEVDDYPNELNKNCLNKVWRYKTIEEVFQLVNAFLTEISKTDRFEQGVIQGLDWSLNEVMDNVLQHSNTSIGYAMGQIHSKSKHVAFCIFDYGQGIYNSLKNSKYAPRSAVDALTLCIKEGITRDKDIGQGNGLFGLHQVVKNNQGLLTITSNSASYFWRRNQPSTFTKLPFISHDNGCTIIDFQLDYDKQISLEEALSFNGKKYETVNSRIENLENNYAEIVYILAKTTGGYGTRKAGQRVRNEIINLHTESNKVIVIDFSGIGVISSSFADELLGKLMAELGFFGFNNLIKLKGMNTTIQSIINRSISQRMSETFT